MCKSKCFTDFAVSSVQLKAEETEKLDDCRAAKLFGTSLLAAYKEHFEIRTIQIQWNKIGSTRV